MQHQWEVDFRFCGSACTDDGSPLQGLFSSCLQAVRAGAGCMLILNAMHWLQRANEYAHCRYHSVTPDVHMCHITQPAWTTSLLQCTRFRPGECTRQNVVASCRQLLFCCEWLSCRTLQHTPALLPLLQLLPRCSNEALRWRRHAGWCGGRQLWPGGLTACNSCAPSSWLDNTTAQHTASCTAHAHVAWELC